MIIGISRSGGFAGIVEDLGTINTGNLQEDGAADLENRVAEIARSLAQRGDNSPIGADMFRYEIEIIGGNEGRQKLVVMDEGDPESPVMKALNELLNAL